MAHSFLLHPLSPTGSPDYEDRSDRCPSDQGELTPYITTIEVDK